MTEEAREVVEGLREIQRAFEVVIETIENGKAELKLMELFQAGRNGWRGRTRSRKNACGSRFWSWKRKRSATPFS